MTWKFLAGIGILVLIDYIWTALFRRVRKGRFRVRTDDANAFEFDSNFGRFRIDHLHKRLVNIGKQGRVTVPFTDIAALRFSHDDEWALFSEWFFGFDITDVFAQYRDRTHWLTIAIRRQDGSELPLFIAGQYEPREFLLGWYIGLQARILGALGLFHDIDDYCRQVLERIQAQFQKAGLQVPIRPGRPAST